MPAARTKPNPAAAVLGVWTTPGDKSRVRIYKAQDGTYGGKIIWLKHPTYAKDYKKKALAGKPKVDIHNPDKKLRSRPILGLKVLTGFQYSPSNNDWRNGKCYEPEQGKTYTCRMWLKNHDTLMLRGYVWIFHRTMEWHRYLPLQPQAPATTTAAPAGTVD